MTGDAQEVTVVTDTSVLVNFLCYGSTNPELPSSTKTSSMPKPRTARKSLSVVSSVIPAVLVVAAIQISFCPIVRPADRSAEFISAQRSYTPG